MKYALWNNGGSLWHALQVADCQFNRTNNVHLIHSAVNTVVTSLCSPLMQWACRFIISTNEDSQDETVGILVCVALDNDVTLQGIYEVILEKCLHEID